MISNIRPILTASFGDFNVVVLKLERMKYSGWSRKYLADKYFTTFCKNSEEVRVTESEKLQNLPGAMRRYRRMIKALNTGNIKINHHEKQTI